MRKLADARLLPHHGDVVHAAGAGSAPHGLGYGELCRRGCGVLGLVWTALLHGQFSAVEGGPTLSAHVYILISIPQILFILFGLLTVLWSTVLWFFLPDSPDDAYFLNEKERTFAALRPKKSQHTTQTKIWKQDQFVETLRDPKSWWFAVFMFNLMVPSGGVTAVGSPLQPHHHA